jgi:hypothetical protein
MFGRKKKEESPIIEVKKKNTLIFLAYLVLGLYFINKQFNYLNIPEIVAQFDNWITLIAGLFLLFGAYHYYKANK